MVAIALKESMSPQATMTTSNWRVALPRLTGDGVLLREVRLSDAPALFALLTTEEVSRFISPPPTTVEGFERFIAWAHQQRSAGRYVCFAVVPAGYDTAVGIFQVRQIEAGSSVSEWGFAIASPFWGTGLFQRAATTVLEFTFEVLGVQRLEARAAIVNGRGNGALRKIGAVQECVLRRSFLRGGQIMDQALWAILATDRESRKPSGERVPAKDACSRSCAPRRRNRRSSRRYFTRS